jgi:predicted DNA-binding protein YlxM (UPF0122 family)
MASKKLSERVALQLLDQGLSLSAIGEQYGITKQAVHDKVRRARGRTVKAVVAKKLDKLADKQLDGMQQLIEINRKTLALLDQAEKAEDKFTQLKCIGEVRQQLSLLLDIQESLYNTRVASEFMSLVVSVLRDTDGGLYAKFKEKLQRERSLRGVLHLA